MSERCAVHPDRAAELTCARCGSYACYECVGSESDGICVRCRHRAGRGEGNLRYVPTLAILTIVNGALITCFGLIYIPIGAMFPMLPKPPQGQEDAPVWLMASMFACFGLVHIVPGIMQIIAGVRLRKYRGRTLALVSFGVGAMTILGCYCSITSIGLAIFGLVVLLDSDVRAHFEQVERDEARLG